MPESLEIKKNAPSGTILLNRPDRRNALSRSLIREIQAAFEDLHQEKDVRAVILTGKGTAFCAGMDLEEMQKTAESDNSQEQWFEDSIMYKDLLQQMLHYPKPIIAAVNGPAVAGGAGLVLAADIVVGTANARFGFPEPKRGIVAGLVASILNFRIGGGQAARLLLTADLITGDEAYRLGLYHESVDTEMTWVRAHEIAVQIAESAPESLQLTKQLINETLGEHLGTQLSVGAAASATARTTRSAREGLAAFLEKRQPDWNLPYE